MSVSLVIESASHFCVWILGICAAIHFLQMFSTELKPLVMAFVFVSILEVIVQFFEWFMQKAWCLFKLILKKWWQLTGLAIVEVLGLPNHKKEIETLWRSILRDGWSELFRGWEGHDVGHFALIRILAVVITLLIVAFGCVALYNLVIDQLTVVISKVSLYTTQVQALANYVQSQLPDLEAVFPEQYRDRAKELIDSIQAHIRTSLKDMPTEAQKLGLSVLNWISTTSSALLMDLIFFLLYCAFMLFDPLHINLEEREEEQGWGMLGTSHALVDGWLKKTTVRMGNLLGKKIGRGTTMAKNTISGALKRSTTAICEGSSPSEQLAATAARTTSLEGGFDVQGVPPLAAEGQVEAEEDRLAERADDRFTCTKSLAVLAAQEDAEEEEFDNRPSLVRVDSARASNKGAEKDRIKLVELQQYIYKIVWQYFLCLVCLNTILAVSIFVLLVWLNVDLSLVLACMCFLLSFIPELGVLISIALPVPFVLLTPTDACRTYHLGPDLDGGPDGSDCIADFGDRLKKMCASFCGMLLLKFLVANGLSAAVMGRNRFLAGALGDRDAEVRETHGVLVLFAVIFSGKVWGTVGMIISVPILSIIRLTINIGLERERGKEKSRLDRLQEEEEEAPTSSTQSKRGSWIRRLTATATNRLRVVSDSILWHTSTDVGDSRRGSHEDRASWHTAGSHVNHEDLRGHRDSGDSILGVVGA